MDYDDAYANAAYVPEAADLLAQWPEAAQEFRQIESAVGRARLNQPYGDGPRAAFDLFYPAGRPEGLLIFIHGGYWRMLDRRDFSHFAVGAQDAGWAVAMPSYPLAPDARISQITQEISRAVQAAAATTPGPIVIAGHSAGGHLAARMAMADVDIAEAAARLRRIVSISPVADLRPLMHTRMQADFQLTEEEAQDESPALGQPRPGTHAHVWVGGAERPAFLDQARWLSQAWDCQLTIRPKRHHFDIIEGLKDAESPLMQACLSP